MMISQYTTEVVSVSYWGTLSIILRYPKYVTDLTNILLCKYLSSVCGANVQDHRLAHAGKERKLTCQLLLVSFNFLNKFYAGLKGLSYLYPSKNRIEYIMAEDVKFAENVILVDVAYFNDVVKDLKRYFELQLGRPLQNIYCLLYTSPSPRDTR